MEWFYANERDEQIAIDESDLPSLVANGVIERETLVWREGLADWVECAKLKPSLFEPVVRAPAPTDAPAAEGRGPDDTPPLPPAAPVPMSPPESMAVGSLVCGILGLAGCMCAGIFASPFSIAGVVLGHLAKKKLLDAGNTEKVGLAKAGLITGYIGLGLGVLMLLFMVGMMLVSVTAG